MPPLLQRILSVFALTTLLCASSSHADTQLAARPAPSPVYTVNIQDQWGNALRTFNHKGRLYVLGDYGDAYQVRIDNHTGQRVEAVISVDGRDAVSGAVADYASQRGYVIAPYDSVTIEGFRESFDNVRQFRFTNPGNSYSGRRGTPQYVGVIGVAFFPERVAPSPQPLAKPLPEPRYPEPQYETPRAPAPKKRTNGRGPRPRDSNASESSSSAPSSRSAAGSSAKGKSSYGETEMRDDAATRPEGTGNLGTEYGERNYSPAREVSFSRQNAKNPRYLVRLYYDDESGLSARGIQVRPPPRCDDPCCLRPCYSEPDPFPATRFAPPPP